MLPTAAPAPRILVASLWRCARITRRHSMHTSAKPAAPLRPPSTSTSTGPAALAAAAARGRLTLGPALPRPRPAWSPSPHAHRYPCHAAFSTSASRRAKNQVFSPYVLSQIPFFHSRQQPSARTALLLLLLVPLSSDQATPRTESATMTLSKHISPYLRPRVSRC